MLQDRATAQMGAVIPLPDVAVREVERWSGKSGHWLRVVDTEPVARVTVPVDFYLREALDIDPWDWGQIEDFVKTWGIPVDHLNRDLGGDADKVEGYALDEGTLAEGYTLRSGREAAAVEMGLIPQRVPLSRRVDEMEARERVLRSVVNLGEVIMRVGRMKGFCGVVAGLNQEDAYDYLDLNAALSAFAPAVVPLNVEPITQEPTVYTVCALQIVNDLHEGATTQVCQNESCGRTFTKQRGRGSYGVHRTKGVMYCSKECAKAQAQRELRRRRRKGVTE